MPRRLPSSKRDETARIVALGGGHGLAAVVRALRGERVDLTVVVTIADDGGSSGELRRQRNGPAFGDMRRCLIASSSDGSPLTRVLDRPVAISALGRHPIGNLVLRSVTHAFGNLEEGSSWMAQQLGAHARVLPACSEPVSLVAQLRDGQIVGGESAIGATREAILRLGFVPARPAVPRAVTEAIASADLLLISPGSLFTSILAACSLPEIATALASAPAPVTWIANLIRDGGETATMSANDHLDALRRHGVRIDNVLFDPNAALAFSASDIHAAGLRPLTHPLRSSRRGEHDPTLLRTALRELVGTRSNLSEPAPPSSSS